MTAPWCPLMDGQSRCVGHMCAACVASGAPRIVGDGRTEQPWRCAVAVVAARALGDPEAAPVVDWTVVDPGEGK